MSIKIEMLRCFCAVAKAGNLSDAADQLGRTQSAVSMILKQLEQHLGSNLFESERKNRLTTLGEQVFALGSKQLSQFDSTIQAITDSAKAPQGLLRMASVPSVAAFVYPPVVDFLSTTYPELRLELRDSNTQQVIDALVQGWADIGIASRYFTLKETEATPLFQDQFGLVCAANHPLLEKSDQLRLDDVFSTRFVRNSLCDQIETPAFQDRMASVPTLLHNTHSLLATVYSGRWVTVLPKSVMAFAPNDLCFQPIVDLPDVRQVYLYVRQQTHLSEVVNDVRTYITAQDRWAAFQKHP